MHSRFISSKQLKPLLLEGYWLERMQTERRLPKFLDVKKQ
jgi:hypothetical protein